MDTSGRWFLLRPPTAVLGRSGDWHWEQRFRLRKDAKALHTGFVPQVPGVLKYATDERGKWKLSEVIERNKLHFRHVIRGFQTPTAHSCQAVYDDSVFARRIYDFINSELLLHFDFEPCLLLQFTRSGRRNTLKGFYFPAWQDPTSTVRVLIALSQQDAPDLISNDDC
jgi:hypothetical protein